MKHQAYPAVYFAGVGLQFKTIWFYENDQTDFYLLEFHWFWITVMDHFVQSEYPAGICRLAGFGIYFHVN